MTVFIGLDISLDETHICVVDKDGKTLKETKVMTEPEAIAPVLRRFGDDIKRVGFEASSLSPWLRNELLKLGFPAIIGLASLKWRVFWFSCSLSHILLGLYMRRQNAA